MMCFQRYLALIAVLVYSSAIACHAKDSAIANRLQTVANINSLDDPSFKPWHLKLSFQLADEKGNLGERGTIEEWWIAPAHSKTIYTSPSYTSTEVRKDDDLYRTRGSGPPPVLLEWTLRQVVHPLPEQKEIAESKLISQELTYAKVPMDCVMITQEIRNLLQPPPGLFPTFCLDHDADSLRAITIFGTRFTVRNRIATFRGHYVGIDQATAVNSVNLITGHIETLEGSTLTDADLVPTDHLENINAVPVLLSAEELKKFGIGTQPKPHYPELAKRNHISGDVHISVRIGHDGRIRFMKVLSAPDPTLAIAALSVLPDWRYQPYVVNGKPTEVESTITMSFNMW